MNPSAHRVLPPPNCSTRLPEATSEPMTLRCCCMGDYCYPHACWREIAVGEGPCEGLSFLAWSRTCKERKVFRLLLHEE